MSLKQRLEEYWDLQVENRNLNLKMSKLFDHGVVDNEGNLIE